jgi:ADP-ribosylglycohydrolase
VLEEAKKTALCTHDHPEGVKGAQTVALAIFVANQHRRCNEQTKDVVKSVIDACVDFSGYDIDIRKEDVENKFDETCQGTVPVALWVINQSTGFEDAIRRAVSLGADADTLGAIVGSIAEAIWGIPEDMKAAALSYLDDRMKKVLTRWKESVIAEDD